MALAVVMPMLWLVLWLPVMLAIARRYRSRTGVPVVSSAASPVAAIIAIASGVLGYVCERRDTVVVQRAPLGPLVRPSITIMRCRALTSAGRRRC